MDAIRRGVAVSAAIVAASAAMAAAAHATTPAPAWSIDTFAATPLIPGDSSGHGYVIVRAINTGGLPLDGSPVTITDQLPPGLTVDTGSGGAHDIDSSHNITACSGTQTVSCVVTGRLSISGAIPTFVPSYAFMILIPVDVSSAVDTSVENVVSVGGGGASGANASAALKTGAQSSDFGVRIDGRVTDSDGSAVTQAGSHPFAVATTIDFAGRTDSFGDWVPNEDVKDITVDLPVGFVGNPTAVPTCTPAQLLSGTCPADSQIGLLQYFTSGLGNPVGSAQLPVFNMAPRAGFPAQFGMSIVGHMVYLDARVRTGGDYGLSVDITNLTQVQPLVSTVLTLWGVPADPLNDPARSPDGGNTFGVPSLSPQTPLFTNPGDCSHGPFTTAMRADSWQSPGEFKAAGFVSHLPDGTPTGVTGCQSVPFSPTLDVAPSGAGAGTAGAPTGLSVDLKVPQPQDPQGIAEAALKRAVVRLPAGVAVSASSADGLQACSSAQIALDSADDPTCPEASKVGSAEIDTPLLSSPLRGGVYLGAQRDNPFGTLLAIYIVAKDPTSGVLIKLPGRVDADSTTGQITATFDNNPQLPFTDLKLDFFGGSRAALQAPKACGTYTAHTDMTSWSSDTPVGYDSTFSINAGCGQDSRFTPSFSAGMTNPRAAATSTFTLDVSRPSGQQDLGALDVSMPAGLLGYISKVPRCPEPQAAAGTCASASRIGTTTVASGPGASPVYIPQPGKAPTAVYLAGPYKGAPFSLSIVVPAQAGPLDLGTVVVRAAIYVDPTTAALRIVSDPLPTIMQGIPLSIQRINVTVDRPGFMLNPTNCTATQVAATISSAQGAASRLASRFQVGDCAALRYTPKLSLSVGRKGRTSRGKHLPFTAVLTQPAGQANNRTVQTTLPGTINSRIASLKTQCAMSAFLAEKCPAGSKVGTASAITPVLSAPLYGNVFFIKNPKGGLPTMWIELKGQGVRLNVRGDISIPHSKFLRVRIAAPDAPVTRFRLSLTDGANAPLSVAASSLCTAKSKADPVSLGFRAQNGKLVQVSQRLHIAGCAVRKAKSTKPKSTKAK